MLRVLHFSDVHVYSSPLRTPLRDWSFPKRVVGAANLLLRRRRRFVRAAEKLSELARFVDRERIDVRICTGDYTALGTLRELERARHTMQALIGDVATFVTLPGNHDLYLPDSLAQHRFERTFGDLLQSDWPVSRTGETFPAVRLFGDQLAVISVNSSRPNPALSRSSGRIPDAQLAELSLLLSDSRLKGRRLFVATHYAPRRADGTPDRASHGLENAEELLEIVGRVPRVAILHGHIHHRFHVRVPPTLSLFGAGSATDAGREGAWLFEIDADSARAFAVEYADGGYRRVATPAIEL